MPAPNTSTAVFPATPSMGGPWRSLLRRAALIRTLAVLSVVAVGGFWAVPASASSPATTVAAEGDTTPDFDHHVVVIGTGGLRWTDMNQVPAIANFASVSAVGSLVVRNVRSSTCPADGWLAFSAGQRAGDALNGGGGPCRYLQDPTVSDIALGAAQVDAQVPNWSDYEEAVTSQKYNATLGNFGQVLADSGVSTAAVGPGAAIALADASGTIQGNFYPRPAAALEFNAQVRQAITGHSGDKRLTVIDPGYLRIAPFADPADPAIAARLSEIDSRVEGALRAIYAQDPGLTHTTIVLASLSDPVGSPRLSILAMAGDQVSGNFLTSPSTKQSGFNQATDLPTTVFSLLGISDLANRSIFVGSVITPQYVAMSAAERIATLVDIEDHTLATRPLVERFFLLYSAVNILLFLAVAYIFSGRFLRRITRAGTWIAKNSRALITACQIAGIAIASMPVATLLANTVPWWRTGAPTLTLIGLSVAIIAAITTLALLPAWRGWRFGPIAVVAGITAIVLAIDIATGARMQLSALMGVQPMVGGRFYGFNNQAFALFATASILLAGAIANGLVSRGKRKTAALAVAVVGIIATLLNGSPTMGADFGGPPALVPAFALLTLWAAGIKLNIKRVLLVLASGVVVVSTFALADWLRPADKRTHLGRFVDTVLDGGLFEVVGRKIGANLSTFTNPLTLVAVTAILLLIIVMGRPVRLAAKQPNTLAPYHWLTNGVPLKQIATDTPMFLPTTYAVYVALLIGTLVNDSGVVIAAVGLGLLVPLLIATYARWILGITRHIPESSGVLAQH